MSAGSGSLGWEHLDTPLLQSGPPSVMSQAAGDFSPPRARKAPPSVAELALLVRQVLRNHEPAGVCAPQGQRSATRALPRALQDAFVRSPEVLREVRSTLMDDDNEDGDKRDALDLLRWLAPYAPTLKTEVDVYTTLTQPLPLFPTHWRPWAILALMSLALIPESHVGGLPPASLVVGEEGARRKLVKLIQEVIMEGEGGMSSSHVLAETCHFVSGVAAAAVPASAAAATAGAVAGPARAAAAPRAAAGVLAAAAAVPAAATLAVPAGAGTMAAASLAVPAGTPSSSTVVYEDLVTLCIEGLTEPLLLLLRRHWLGACQALLALLKAQPARAAATILRLGGVEDVVQALQYLGSESVELVESVEAVDSASQASGSEALADTYLTKPLAAANTQPGQAAVLLDIFHRMVDSETAGAATAGAASAAAVSAGAVTALVGFLGSGAAALRSLARLLHDGPDMQAAAAAQRELLQCEGALDQLVAHWRQAPVAVARILWCMRADFKLDLTNVAVQGVLFELLCLPPAAGEDEAGTTSRFNCTLSVLLELAQSGHLQSALAGCGATASLLAALDVAYGHIRLRGNSGLAASLLRRLWASLATHPPTTQLMASSPEAGEPCCITAALSALQLLPVQSDAAQPISAHMAVLLNVLRALHPGQHPAQALGWLHGARAVIQIALYQQLGGQLDGEASAASETADLQALQFCEHLANHLISAAHGGASGGVGDHHHLHASDLALAARYLISTCATTSGVRLEGVGTLDVITVKVDLLQRLLITHDDDSVTQQCADILFSTLPSLLLSGELAADVPQPLSDSSPLLGVSAETVRHQLSELFKRAAATRPGVRVVAGASKAAGCAALGCHSGLMERALEVTRHPGATRMQELTNIMALVRACVDAELANVSGCPVRYSVLPSQLGALVPWAVSLMATAASGPSSQQGAGVLLQAATYLCEVVTLHLTPVDVLCQVLGCAADPVTTLQQLRERLDQAGPQERARLSQMALALVQCQPVPPEDYQRLPEQLEVAQRQLAPLAEDKAQLQLELAAAQRQLALLQRQVKAGKRYLASQADNNDRVHRQLQIAQRRLPPLTEENSRLKWEVQAAQGQLAPLVADKARLQRELKAVQQQLAVVTVDNTRLKLAAEGYLRLQQELQAAQQQLVPLAADKTRLQQELKAATTQAQNKVRLHRELQAAQDKIILLQGLLKAAQRHPAEDNARVQQELQGLRQRVAALAKDKQQLRAELQAAQESHEEWQQRLPEPRRTRSRYQDDSEPGDEWFA